MTAKEKGDGWHAFQWPSVLAAAGAVVGFFVAYFLDREGAGAGSEIVTGAGPLRGAIQHSLPESIKDAQLALAALLCFTGAEVAYLIIESFRLRKFLVSK